MLQCLTYKPDNLSRISIRFIKKPNEDYIIIIEKDNKRSKCYGIINMWAEKSLRGADARK